MTEEPELLCQWRAERREKSRRTLRLFGIGAMGSLIGGIVVGGILGIVMIVRDFAPPDPPGTILLAKIMTSDDGLFIIEVRAKFQGALDCLAARENMPASERIMFECVAR